MTDPTTPAQHPNERVAALPKEPWATTQLELPDSPTGDIQVIDIWEAPDLARTTTLELSVQVTGARWATRTPTGYREDADTPPRVYCPELDLTFLTTEEARRFATGLLVAASRIDAI